MGQGSYVICEWDSVAKEYPGFQQAFMNLEQMVLSKCSLDWNKRFNAAHTFGGGDGEFGRTTILPGAFGDHTLSTPITPLVTWRQTITAAEWIANSGAFTWMTGVGAGNIIPEGVKIALMGFAFPNKQQHITEFKMQYGDTKYGRFNIEAMQIMNKPAIIFEEGMVLDEETAFDLYAYIEGPNPTMVGGWNTIYQRMVPIGALYYSSYTKVGGVVGSAIPST